MNEIVPQPTDLRILAELSAWCACQSEFLNWDTETLPALAAFAKRNITYTEYRSVGRATWLRYLRKTRKHTEAIIRSQR